MIVVDEVYSKFCNSAHAENNGEKHDHEVALEVKCATFLLGRRIMNMLVCSANIMRPDLLEAET